MDLTKEQLEGLRSLCTPEALYVRVQKEALLELIREADENPGLRRTLVTLGSHEPSWPDDFLRARASLGVKSDRKPVFCTCGAETEGLETIPDPGLAWRHLSQCPHSFAKR